MADETIGLKLTVEGTDEYAKAATAVAKVQAQLEALESSYSRGLVPNVQYQAEFRQLNAELARAEKAYTNVIDPAKKAADGVKEVSESSKKGAQALMLMSQTLDDAQYGFRAIVNNIPMVVTQVAQGMGVTKESALALGGALGMLAVAVNQNLQRWEEWRDLLMDIGGKSLLDNITKTLTLMDSQFSGGWGKAIAQESKGKEAQKRMDAELAEQAKEGEARAKGVANPIDQERGRMFVAALEQLPGGGEGFRDEMKRNAVEGIEDAKEKARTERDLDVMFNRAFKGDTVASGGLLQSMPGEAQKAFEAAGERAANALAKQIADADTQEKRRDLERELTRHDPAVVKRANEIATDLIGEAAASRRAREDEIRHQAEAREAAGYADQMKGRTVEMATRGKTFDRSEIEAVLRDDYGMSDGQARYMGGLVAQKIERNLETVWKVAIREANARDMGPPTFEKMLEQVNDPIRRDQLEREHTQARGRDAYRQMQEIQMEWLRMNDPATYREARGMQAMQRRLNNKNAAGNVAARQAAMRAAGGMGSFKAAGRRAKANQSLAERWEKAATTFEEAVDKLTKGDIQIVL